MMGLVRKLGDGRKISFWNEVWLGEEKLRIAYPRLYSAASSKEATVYDLDVWRDGVWCWRLEWHRGLFTWENVVMDNLLLTLQNCAVNQNREDSWSWLGQARFLLCQVCLPLDSCE